MASEDDVRAKVKETKGGSIEACYGPSPFADIRVWEVWVAKDGEYKTRFVVERAGELLYFGEFEQLLQYLNGRRPDLLRLYVAAVVFVAGSLTLFYLNLRGIEPNLVSFASLASLIASGGYMFFGNWQHAT